MRKNIADQIAETLAAQGVERIYGVVGDSLHGITESLGRQEKIRCVSRKPARWLTNSSRILHVRLRFATDAPIPRGDPVMMHVMRSCAAAGWEFLVIAQYANRPCGIRSPNGAAAL
jgi:hypothetical protein